MLLSVNPGELRGAVVGAASALTAVLAHGLAHGTLPTSDALVLLLAVCAGFGWLISTRTRAPMVPLLLGGQVLAHTSTVLLTGESLTHGWQAMLPAHAVATPLAAVVGHLLEVTVTGLCTAVVATAGAVVSVIALITRTTSSAPRVPGTVRDVVDDVPRRSGRRSPSVDGTRGPPLGRQFSPLLRG